MRVFVTGASGWIGSATVDELLAAGHEVTGLRRVRRFRRCSPGQAVHVRRGDLDDLASIRAGAEAAEAVIHLANKHDWSNPAASSAAERAAVQTIGDALVGTGHPFLLASGVAALTQGRAAREDAERSPFHGPESPRGGSENLALGVRRPRCAHCEPALCADRARSWRPRVHRGDRRGGPGEGRLRLPRRRDQPVSPPCTGPMLRASSLSDSAKAPAGARLHAVAEDGIPTRNIAEAIGRAFGLPVTSIAPDDSRSLRVDRHLLRHGSRGDEHRDTGASRLGTRRPHPHRRPRRGCVLGAHADGRVRRLRAGALIVFGYGPGTSHATAERSGARVTLWRLRHPRDSGPEGAARAEGAVLVKVIEYGRQARTEHLPADVAQQLGHEDSADAGEAGVVVGEAGAPGVGFEPVDDLRYVTSLVAGRRVAQQRWLVHLQDLAVNDAAPAGLGLGEEPLRHDGGEPFRPASRRRSRSTAARAPGRSRHARPSWGRGGSHGRCGSHQWDLLGGT